MIAFTRTKNERDITTDAESDLPEGWALVNVSEICEVNPPKPAADALNADMPVTFVPMPAVDADSGTIMDPEVRQFGEVRKGFTAFREGDVIMAKITPCMENGKAAITRQLKNGLGFGSTEFHVLRSNEATLPGFIYHLVRQESYRREAESEMTGSVGQRRVPAEFIRQTEIGLPPLAEQTRIVTKIEELFKQINASRGHLVEVPKILKRFRQSVLAAACSGRLTEAWRVSHPIVEPAQALVERIDAHERKTEKHSKRGENSEKGALDSSEMPDLPNSWLWTEMGRVAEIQGGIQKQPKRTPKSNPYPYLRVANVLRDRLDLTEVSQMEIFPGELATYRLSPGDLLIVEGNGSLAEIGRSSLWAGEIDDCVHQNHIIRVRPVVCSPHYLNYYWNSPVGMGRVAEVAVTTAGLYSLSTKKVATLPVALPPLEEQQEIVRRVKELFTQAQKIEKQVGAATKRADKLTQVILAKAFRGELVPTEAELARQEGRDYEPASVLLSRIKAAGEKTETTTTIPNRSSGRTSMA